MLLQIRVLPSSIPLYYTATYSSSSSPPTKLSFVGVKIQSVKYVFPQTVKITTFSGADSWEKAVRLQVTLHGRTLTRHAEALVSEDFTPKSKTASAD